MCFKQLLIENLFAWLKPYRAIATHDDQRGAQRATKVLDALYLAAAVVWLS